MFALPGGKWLLLWVSLFWWGLGALAWGAPAAKGLPPSPQGIQLLKVEPQPRGESARLRLRWRYNWLEVYDAHLGRVVASRPYANIDGGQVALGPQIVLSGPGFIEAFSWNLEPLWRLARPLQWGSWRAAQWGGARGPLVTIWDGPQGVEILALDSQRGKIWAQERLEGHLRWAESGPERWALVVEQPRGATLFLWDPSLGLTPGPALGEVQVASWWGAELVVVSRGEGGKRTKVALYSSQGHYLEGWTWPWVPHYLYLPPHSNWGWWVACSQGGSWRYAAFNRRGAPQSAGQGRPELLALAPAGQGLYYLALGEAGSLSWGELAASTPHLWGARPLPKGAEPPELWSLEGGIALVERGSQVWTGEAESKISFYPYPGSSVRSSPPLRGQIESAESLPEGQLWVSDLSQLYWWQPLRGIMVRTLDLQPIGDWTKWPNLAGVLLLGGAVAFFIFQAQRGKQLYIRPLAGVEAIEEAIGRATEMGRPVLYLTGVGEIDDTQTMAALSILGYVSASCADYDVPLSVPNCSPVVMSMAQDIVSRAYLQAGRPESYQSDSICYLSGEQFGFAAGVCGLMVRERPAAIFYMGNFLAEALMLAETGHATGAIQIAGSASASQLPFFVAACDYTLLGEELYAASAYLSQDPLQIGSLKGQDAAKALIMGLIILGVAAVSLGYHF